MDTTGAIGTQHDVAVVGGGIAGGALATVLARAGLDVVVLERQEVYDDRARGEWLVPWGVAVTRRLGLHEAIAGPGTSAVLNDRLCFYDAALHPDEAEAAAVDVGTFLPGEPGGLFLSHPETCAALTAAASTAGAQIRRGVSDVKVAGGERPEVAFRTGERRHRVRCRLLVGADGRHSTVRRQLGIALGSTDPQTMWAGLLVDGLGGWAPGWFGRTVTDRAGLAVCPVAGGRARLWLQYPVADHPQFSGPDRATAFLRAFDVPYLRGHEEFRGLRPVGPCAGSAAGDTWAATPLVPGAALVGDAAGYNDPITGNGLALALQDVATLSGLLVGADDWSVPALGPYAAERAERLARARFLAEVVSDVLATFGPEATAARPAALARMAADPELNGPLNALFAGFDRYPDRAQWPEIRRRIAAGP